MVAGNWQLNVGRGSGDGEFLVQPGAALQFTGDSRSQHNYGTAASITALSQGELDGRVESFGPTVNFAGTYSSPYTRVTSGSFSIQAEQIIALL